MNFEILLDDTFLNVCTDSELGPIENKRILSLINDFEEEKWRYTKFQSFIWDNIALTALSENERASLAGKSHSELVAAAKNLRLTDKDGDFSKGSELAEIVLYGIMSHHYKALSVVPKIFYKQNTQDFAKGSDSVHIVIESNADFSLWFGEAKFYNNIEDARLPEIINSVSNSLKSDKLKKENSIITNVSDIDNLITDNDLKLKIKDALSSKNSIDLLKAKIHIPILLLHVCEITNQTTKLTETYKQKIVEFHRNRANAYFKKQIESLAEIIHGYSDIKFHIILFPVPRKDLIVDKFILTAQHYRKE